MIDSRCEIVGIVAPQYIDAGLKGTLRFLARLGKKKILFLELDEVARIISMNDKIDLQNM